MHDERNGQQVRWLQPPRPLQSLQLFCGDCVDLDEFSRMGLNLSLKLLLYFTDSAGLEIYLSKSVEYDLLAQTAALDMVWLGFKTSDPPPPEARPKVFQGKLGVQANKS